MNQKQLDEFYFLKSCEEHDQVDKPMIKAFTFSAEGDAIMSSECMLNAAVIITDTLEREKEYKRTNKEMNAFVNDLTQLRMGGGGLFE